MNSAYLFMLRSFVTLLVSTEVASVTFYPFGTSARDHALMHDDDASTRISIQFDFPFFGKIYQQLYISTNGIITFGNGTNDYIPRPFPVSNLQGVAAYWTDSDPSINGNVFYREETSTTILRQITAEIRSRFVQYDSFSSIWALIITFNNIPAYGCGCASNCNAVVNHQTILTSDGINSFAIFTYDRLDYTAGTLSCGAHAQIGFNAGDGKRFFLVPFSNSANIKKIALQSSNVGIPGKWMFTIGDDISGVCNSAGLLIINPRKIFYFGYQEVVMTGPCFTANDTSVKVWFAQISVDCAVVDGLRLKCLAPFLNTTGRISVMFQHENRTYSNFLVSAGPEDSSIADLNITSFEMDPNTKFTLHWNPNLIPNMTIVTVRGYQTDFYIDAAGTIVSTNHTGLIYGNISNIGEVERDPFVGSTTPVPPSNGQLVRRLMLLIDNSIVRITVTEVRDVAQKICRRWHDLQPSQQEIKNIVDQVSRRSPCPPAISANFPNQITNFVLDPGCSQTSSSACSFFHPGAKGCYRSTNNNGGHAAQCCYSDRNELILGPPGGGRMDWVDSLDNLSSNFLSDILPYVACCKYSTNLCDLYYEKRPAIGSRFYVPPTPVIARGDPHFTTVDGTIYDFNPIGEFVYFRSDVDEIQVRISQFSASSGAPISACYVSAVVIKASQSEIVQVELNALQTFTIKVNGELLTLDKGSWNLDSIYLSLVNNATLNVQTKSGMNSEIVIMSRMLHLITSIPERFKGKVSGLIGNWDDNQDNDLMSPDGAWIPANSSKIDIHYKFGMKWQTTNRTSLFSYPDALSWQDYQNSDFTPDFSSPPPNPTCGNDAACLYDFHVTGDKNVGLTNLIVQNRTEAIAANYARISETCSSQVTIPNADVSIRSDSSSIHYSIHCRGGLELIGGDADVTCTRGKYTSSFGICSPITGSPTSNVSPKSFNLKRFLVVSTLMMSCALALKFDC